MASKRLFKMEIEDEIELINISSDNTNSLDGVSISTFDSAEYNDEITQMICKMEHQVSTPKTVAGRKMTFAPNNSPIMPPFTPPSTSSSLYTPKSKLSKSYFDLRNMNAPYRKDERLRERHPISKCASLTPLHDSPLSPPVHERGPTVTFKAPSPLNDLEVKNEPAEAPQTLPGPDPNLVRSHLQGIRLPDGSVTNRYSDCIICGRSVESIREASIVDYLNKTRTKNETPEMTEAKRKAFTDGMAMGTLMFVPAGLSQAAACDGITYTISGTETVVIPGTLPVV